MLVFVFYLDANDGTAVLDVQSRQLLGNLCEELTGIVEIKRVIATHVYRLRI